MNCYAWNIPVGCYNAALDADGGYCPLPWWFWLAAAGAVAMVALGGGKQKPAKRVAGVRRKR
jgi:hypothetical protein